MDKKDLKIQALTELVVEYMGKMTDLRVEYTLLSSELESLKNEVELQKSAETTTEK
jgi:hypothetical protein